jgi:hypothetical protein
VLPLTRLQINHALFRQTPQCFTHRRTTDTQLDNQFLFDESLARHIAPAENPHADSVKNLVGQATVVEG